MRDPKPSPKRQTNLRLPEDLIHRLTVAAAEDRRGYGELAAEAIEQWLRRREKRKARKS
jgi:hypothetical protein